MNNKKILKISFALAGLLIIFSAMATPALAVQSASATRDIQMQLLMPGESTDITVTITNNVTQSLSLQESIPEGWTLTRVSDAADQYKPSTNEWVWFTVNAGATETVIYNLTVPTNATAGDYLINGTIMNVSGIIDTVKGDDTIRVTLDKTLPTIEFVEPPTPENDTVIDVSYVNVTVNVTDNFDLVDTVAILWWGGANETMTNIGYAGNEARFYFNKTGLTAGTYSYKVYANDTAGNMGVSETRVVKVGNILDYYRSWLTTGDPNVVETQELLKAADDWSNDVVPPGFTDPLTTQELLQLAEEWAAT